MKYLFKSLMPVVISFMLASGSYAQVSESTGKKIGIDPENMDTSIEPSVDFFSYANGGWIKRNPVPPEHSIWGSFTEISEENKVIIKSILEEAALNTSAPEGSSMKKIGDLFYSAMDTTAIENAGVTPLRKDFDRLSSMQSIEDVQKNIAYLQSFWVSSVFGFFAGQDDKNSKDVVVNINQSGLGLPEREYYFRDDAKTQKIREEYVKYITTLFTLTGDDPATAKANADLVFKIETRLAKASMTRVERRDPDKTYNKFTVEGLKELTPDFDWDIYFAEIGVDQGKLDKGIIVGQPEFMKEVNRMMTDVPVEQWKTYLKWKLTRASANALSTPFRNADYLFNDVVLRGVTEQEPRWKEAQQIVSGSLGEAVGELFIEKRFSPDSKTRMLVMVENIKQALGERIKQLDWMSDATKEKALLKLSTFKVKIGYPDKWRDYSDLKVNRGVLVENLRNSSKYSFNRNKNKIGKPVEDEWFMTPQTVNAYYSASQNEIVFPAGILQPPFFDPRADDAVNYGGIGAVIGHEITHGFDDQGRKYDAYGNMTDWWTEEDAQRYTERANKIAEQYNNFVAIDTFKVNGQTTLGENIADLGGITIAYLAYQKTDEYKAGKVIDGFTPAQRFFLGYAQIWRQTVRDDELMMRLNTDSHSPGKFRVWGPLSNMHEFFDAFNIPEGTPMRRSADNIVRIW